MAVCALNRLPDDLKIDIEITMGNAITHTVHPPPGYLRVMGGKLGISNH
ncbi:hypothetical protein SAMN05216604_101319 [Pseudomonas agarici]|nr:hypothetical protein SAMN05216604_101319 [Pseudomonas agarici]